MSFSAGHAVLIFQFLGLVEHLKKHKWEQNATICLRSVRRPKQLLLSFAVDQSSSLTKLNALFMMQ